MSWLKHFSYTNTQSAVLKIMGLLALIPLGPFINRFIPPIQVGEWNLDLALSLLFAFLVIWLILRIFKPLIIPILLVVIGILTWNAFTGSFSYAEMVDAYKSLVKRNWIMREKKQLDILSLAPGEVDNQLTKVAKRLRSRMAYKDSVVRNFAVKASLTYFKDYYEKYGSNARFLSVFKYIRYHFQYVPDAKRDEYFATPRETILNGLGGDCDDHAILMASCLRAIGGITRIVIIRGHAYPELYCGDKKAFEEMQSAIVQLFSDQSIKRIYFHEHDGEYWINMDYTALHPGGPYLNNDVLTVVDW